MWLAEKGGDLYHHPYDLGVYENLISVRRLDYFLFAKKRLNNLLSCFFVSFPEILNVSHIKI